MIVLMFAPQFAPLVEAGTKCQTIRPPRKRPVRIGDTVSLRAWAGKPYRSKQRVLGEGVVTVLGKVSIVHTALALSLELWPSKATPDDRSKLRDRFATRDGFRDWAEMRDWFQQHHGLPFHGILIQWRKL